jgi:hypothetical protein
MNVVTVGMEIDHLECVAIAVKEYIQRVVHVNMVKKISYSLYVQPVAILNVEFVKKVSVVKAKIAITLFVLIAILKCAGRKQHHARNLSFMGLTN